MLRQLLDQLKKIPDDVRKEYSRYKTGPHKIMPLQDWYESMLKTCIEEFFNVHRNRVFILVDAYDELLSTKEGTPEAPEGERRAIRSCLSQIAESDNAKILITTRRHYRKELEDSFPNTQVLDIHADLKDMTTYLSLRLENLSAVKKKKIVDALLNANKNEKW